MSASSFLSISTYFLNAFSPQSPKRKIAIHFCVNFCFPILSFWGFSIMLFLICFFRNFIAPISIDYQYVMNNQQDFKKRIMKKVSNDMRWFVDQLRLAEGILSNAIEKSENFSEHDKRIISKIRREVDMADLTLLQLLSPIAP